MKPRLRLLLGSALVAAATPASAVPYYWDSDGTSPGFGNADGTWGTSAFWGTLNDGTGATANTTITTADSVNFGTATLAYGSSARTITVSGNKSVGSMVFGAAQSPSVKLATTAGTNFITLGAGGSITVNAGNHILEGTGINGSSSRDLVFTTTGASFSIAAASSFEIKGRLGGGNTGASYSKTGAGTLILSGQNGGGSPWTFSSGLFTISQGVVRLANTNAAGSSANIYSVTSGAALELDGGFAQTLNNGTITLNGTGIGSGGALRSVSGNNSIVGSGTGGIVLGTNSSIGVDASTLAINPIISGALRNLTKVGAGALILGGANTYTGTTTVSAGTLVLANTAAVQSSTNVTLSATGTTLQFATDSAFTTLPNITGSSGSNAATLVSDRATAGAGLTHVLGTASFGANTFNFTSGANVTSGAAGISLSAVNMTSGSAGTTVFNPTTAAVTIVGGVSSTNSNFARTLELGGTGTGHSIGGVITQTVASPLSLTKSNTSTWTLNGANTYSGPTTISGGTLALGATGSIAGTSSVTLTSSSARFNVTSADFTLGASQTLGGIGTVENTGRTFTAGGTLAPGNSPGALSVDGGTLALVGGGGYNFQILDAAGAAGSAYDTVNLINGATLDLSSLNAGGYTINLFTLLSAGPDVSGDASNFNNTLSYAWTLFSTGNAIANFEAGDFIINTAGFSNDLAGGSFSLSLADGNTDLVLNFTAVPEPGAALLGGLGVLALLRRRR